MSYSTLYKVYKTKVVEHAEFKNGWGSAPVLWDYLAKVHLGEDKLFMTGYEKVWKLFYNPTIPHHHRLALALTFDYALLEPKHIDEMADACEKVYPEIVAIYPTKENHWHAIAGSLRELSKKVDKRLCGIVLNCTSVSDMYSGADVKSLQFHTIFPFEVKAA